MDIIKAIFNDQIAYIDNDINLQKKLLTPLLNQPINFTRLETLLSDQLLPPSLISLGLKSSLLRGELDTAKWFYQNLKTDQTTHEKEQKIINIYEQIEKFREYAQLVQKTDKNLSDYNPDKLANELKQATQKYVSHTIFPIPSETSPENVQNINKAKAEFEEAFTTAYKAMKTHRAGWKPILANIAIAATGIGLLVIIGKLALTGTGFFSETMRQKQIQTIRENIDKLVELKKTP